MIKLRGHSGCSVSLHHGIVRKVSASKDYNHRLFEQMTKQHQFKHATIKTPEIVSSGHTENGLFYFDMRYIKGNSLSKIFLDSPTQDGLSVIQELSSMTSDQNVDIRIPVLNKVDSLCIAGFDREIITSCDWIVKSGYCHGDMTFENIIVSNNEIYLIDFLDSFANAPIVDHAKILQDAFCYWSFHECVPPKRKLLSVCKLFDTKTHYCMLLLHLHRILPYANSHTKEKVSCMMSKVRQQISQY